MAMVTDFINSSRFRLQARLEGPQLDLILLLLALQICLELFQLVQKQSTALLHIGCKFRNLSRINVTNAGWAFLKGHFVSLVHEELRFVGG
jgi:hypothetical protein